MTDSKKQTPDQQSASDAVPDSDIDSGTKRTADGRGSFHDVPPEGDAHEDQEDEYESRTQKSQSRLLVPTAMELVPGSIDRYVYSRQIVKMQEPRRLNNDDLDERRIIYPESSHRKLINTFRDLRTRLLEVSGNNNFTIVITGATEGAGSSFVAMNLAAAIAFDQAKTALLIDCNLRNPSLHTLLDMMPETGLTDFLDDPDYDIGRIIYPTGIPRLRLIPAGSQRESPSEFFTSFRMKQFLMAVRRRYPDRFIILDAASIAESPDARILAELCDYALVVVPHGRATAQQVQHAAHSINRDKFVGVVMND